MGKEKFKRGRISWTGKGEWNGVASTVVGFIAKCGKRGEAMNG